MSLIDKFNESFKASRGHDLMHALYSASTYGSNSYCFEQVQRMQGQGANDSEAAAAPSQQQKMSGF